MHDHSALATMTTNDECNARRSEPLLTTTILACTRQTYSHAEAPTALQDSRRWKNQLQMLSYIGLDRCCQHAWRRLRCRRWPGSRRTTRAAKAQNNACRRARNRAHTTCAMPSDRPEA
jgi:hypothetical protein